MFQIRGILDSASGTTHTAATRSSFAPPDSPTDVTAGRRRRNAAKLYGRRYASKCCIKTCVVRTCASPGFDNGIRERPDDRASTLGGFDDTASLAAHLASKCLDSAD